jgi:hypothetical protein
MRDYNEAVAFTLKTRAVDLNRNDSLDNVLTDWDNFFYEFVYVVCASGFRATVAVRLTPGSVACQGSMFKMQKVFKNQRKLDAIQQMWNQKSNWPALRESLKTVDDLLARNIGLTSCAKPDVHLCR